MNAAHRSAPLGICATALLVALCLSTISIGARGDEAPVPSNARNDLLEHGQFIHIPGPNPILVPGEKDAWDDEVIEAADVFEDLGTYYLYYHAVGQGKGYRLGVATASHPLGPFQKHGDKPILDLGPPGSWDERHVACATIIKEGLDKYWMWYSGKANPNDKTPEQPFAGKWSIGLATASNPLGPWKKCDANPILTDFGYVGNVVKVNGKYFLYSEFPIGSTGPDYGPLALATADSPAGPWTRWPENPVLRQGESGEWDDGGCSEGDVLYCGGVFHMFYGGAKLVPERMGTRESIGYAYSFDGYNFLKYGRNPVAPRNANPNAAAFAEVHAVAEMPLIYLYHTLRYKEPPVAAGEKQIATLEQIGVQVLATQRPFRFDMPVLNLASLGPKTTTTLAESPPLCLGNVSRVALTAECVYGRDATKGLRVHLRSSCDGAQYDTEDLCSFDVDCKRGQSVRKTFDVDHNVRFAKVLVENPNGSESVSGVRVTATLGDD